LLAQAMNRPVQARNGGLYLRGLLEQGARKSLEPLVTRLGGTADYQSLQQFLADSPWDPELVVRAVAERVAPRIGIEAWVLDDTGFPKDGVRSPGVKRRYSGTLGKIGNCQIGVSLHAVGKQGTVPLGWALYLPEEWCADAARRARAKVPPEVVFKTKPQLGGGLVERAASFTIPRAPVLGDQAYGDDGKLRERLDAAGGEYVLAVGPAAVVFAPETVFALPARQRPSGRPRSRLCPDRKPQSSARLIERTAPEKLKTVAFRDGPDGEQASSRFAFLRVRVLPRWTKGATRGPREEWLIAEWPEGRAEPTDYWLIEPAGRGPTRAPRPPRPSTLEDRARLPPAQGRSRPSTTTKAAPGWAGTTTPRW
jgi:SRSO17 transposase